MSPLEFWAHVSDKKAIYARQLKVWRNRDHLTWSLFFYITIILGAVLTGFAVKELGAAMGVHPDSLLGPMVASSGAVVALVVFLWKEASERRRKTMEAYEKLILGPDLGSALEKVRTAIKNGAYADDDPTRYDTWRLINYIETICAGAQSGLYDDYLVEDFFEDIVFMLVEYFLVESKTKPMPSKAFLIKNFPDNYLPYTKQFFKALIKNAENGQP